MWMMHKIQPDNEIGIIKLCKKPGFLKHLLKSNKKKQNEGNAKEKDKDSEIKKFCDKLRFLTWAYIFVFILIVGLFVYIF